MNILFKYLLLKSVVLITCANTYSMENLLYDSLDSSLFIINYSVVDYSYNITNPSDSSNNNKDNIYHPNILNFIRNKNKERTEIINGQQYIHLTLEEICKYTNTYNKYKKIKSELDSFHSILNWILNKIKLLEVELRKDKLKYKSDMNYMEKYINNSLKDTIDYQKEFIVFLKNIKEQLNNLYSITSGINVEENINKYVKIANKLLVYNNIKQPSYEFYLDIFKNTIDKYEEKYNKNTKYLIKEFKYAHDNLTKKIDKILNNIINKAKSITNIIINNMQENKYFILSIDKYKCRSNFLINELTNIINNASNVCDNMCYTYSVNKEYNCLCRENVLLRLEHYRKKLITDQVITIQELFKKKLIFNSTNTEIITKSQNIIEAIKQKLKMYNI